MSWYKGRHGDQRTHNLVDGGYVFRLAGKQILEVLDSKVAGERRVNLPVSTW